MKNFFEIFLSTMVLMITTIIVISLFTVQTTIIEARNLHASAVQRVEVMARPYRIHSMNSFTDCTVIGISPLRKT